MEVSTAPRPADDTVRLSSEMVAGPDSVPGVSELREQGFTPVEECTGAICVAQVWPHALRTSVPETPSAWMNEPQSMGRLWLPRSPWPDFDLMTALSVLWSWAEQDRVAALDVTFYRRRVVEALAWDQEHAIERARTNGPAS